MSLFSTYSAASIRGFSAPTSSIPANFNLLYSIETTANKDSRYAGVFVSREDIGNGQFVTTNQTFIGNVNVRNIANTFSKTISNLTASSIPVNYGGAFTSVINEQGNLVIIGDYDYIKVFEYQGSDYSLISNLRPKANVTTLNGLMVDISSNANTLITGCGGSNNSFIAVYSRSGNTFTLVENIERPSNIYGQFGFSISISTDGNTFITSGRVSSNSSANSSAVLIYKYSNGNYVLNTTLYNPNLISYFGDDVKLNAAGNIAIITSLLRTFIYEEINNTWTQTANLNVAGRVTANTASKSENAINLNGSTVVTGNIAQNPNAAGAVQNYFKNGSTYQLQQTLTWANSYANSEFGHNLSGDSNCKYIAATNFFNGANSNVHVLSVYENINII